MAADVEADEALTVPWSQETHVLSLRGGRIEVVGEAGSVLVGIERLHIGRSQRCALVLDDTTVSKVHAEVQATSRGVRLLDQNQSATVAASGAASDIRNMSEPLTGPSRRKSTPRPPRQCRVGRCSSSAPAPRPARVRQGLVLRLHGLAMSRRSTRLCVVRRLSRGGWNVARVHRSRRAQFLRNDPDVHTRGVQHGSPGRSITQGVFSACHGSQFSPNGDVLRGPAAAPLAHFAVSEDRAGNLAIQGGQIVAADVRLAV